VTKGTTPTTLGHDYVGAGIPFIRANNLVGAYVDPAKDVLFIDETTDDLLKRSRILPGDVLLSIAGTVGRASRVPDHSPAMNCNQAVCIIRCTSEIDGDFLRYWLESQNAKAQIATSKVTGVISNLSLAEVKSLEIPLPPITEQRRIVAILDKADALRSKRREAIAKLDQLLQSVFLEMFGGSTGTTTSVAELAPSAGAIRTGPFGSQLLHSELVDHGIAVLGIDNAVSNKFIWAKPRFITAEKYSQLSRYRVNPGDVLITIMGTCGRCAVVPDDVPAAINTKHLCCISLDRTRCEPEFLHSYFMMHPIARRYLESRAKGAIMAGLNMGIIKELPVALPSLEDQRRFVTIKKSLERQSAQVISQENRSNELFAALQQRAFAGAL
jgi:type I restriction enzyme S subunit